MCLACLCAGPGREAPENTAAVEEAADHHSGRRADPVEETATTGRQWGTAGGRPGHPSVLVSCFFFALPPTKITVTRLSHKAKGHRFKSLLWSGPVWGFFKGYWQA